jgi:hypothetical protein
MSISRNERQIVSTQYASACRGSTSSVVHRDRAAGERAGHHGARALGREDPVDPQAGPVVVARARRARRTDVGLAVGPALDAPPGDVGATGLVAFTDQVMRAIAALLPPRYRGVYGDAPPATVSGTPA